MQHTDLKSDENELFDPEGAAMLKVIDDFHIIYLERKKRREMLEAIAEQKRKLVSDFISEIRFLATVPVCVQPTIYKSAYTTRAGVFVRGHYSRPAGWQKIDQRNNYIATQTKRRISRIREQLMKLEAHT